MRVRGCAVLTGRTNPGRLVRMDSFKGATALSVTFNDGCMTVDDAVAFLGYVVEFMLGFAREGA